MNAPTRTPWPGRLARAGHSLVLRMALALVAGLLVVSALLWWLVDRVLDAESLADRRQRQTQAAAVVAEAVDREADALRNLAALLATDTELGNSTYYHRLLEGERSHVQASLERLPQGRRVDAQALVDPDGLPLAATGPPGLPLPAIGSPGAPLPPAEGAARSALAWSGAQPWLVALAPVRRGETVIAWLVLGAQVRPLVDALFPPHSALSVRLAAPADAEGRDADELRLPTTDPDRPLRLQVQVPDILRPARDRVLAELRWALPLAGAGLGLLLAGALLWQLRPLRQIGRAAERVGRGDLDPPLPATRAPELAVLVDAFGQMLRNLREFERHRTQAEQRQRLEAIGRMAARVAHDVNNPLTVIQTHLALLARRGDALDAELRASLAKMDHHCQRCRRTVELLLHYGRPLRLHAAPVDPAALCREVAARLPRGGGNSARVVDEAAGASVIADALQIEQVIDNLLANACEAAPGTEVELRVRAEGDGVGIRVADRGPGFAPQALAHAFEPFVTTKRHGTGLGLASCLTIVQGHGGRMRIDAQAAGGVVELWLPLRPPSSHAEAAGPADAPDAVRA